MKLYTFIILLFIAPLIVSCGNRTKKAESTASVKQFTLPKVPTLMQDPAQRAAYIITHYWENYDFADTTLIARADITEQAFADFLYMMPQVPPETVHTGLRTMMRSAAVNPLMFRHFADLSEKYLYEINSPYHNEDFYTTVLQEVIDAKGLEDTYKVRPRYQLKMTMKNRVGEIASPFPELNRAKGNRIVLFFFNPDCSECKAVKAYIAQQKIDRLATVVAVNPDKNPTIDSLYSVRAIPSLYLLDGQKRVLLKDASIEDIHTALTTK